MVLIGLSIVALLAGAALGPQVTAAADAAPAGSGPAPTLWVVFAVFFPAVTGVMAGLGLSGDLRDPIRSIPRGALAATLFGFAIYLTLPVVLHRAASPEALIGDPLIWTRIAPVGALLVIPGLLGAIFSSAVGSILGAPRTLQAMAMDGLAPSFLGRLSGPRREPVIGVAVSLTIALFAVLLGDLNAVAPVVTMFFLTVYGMVNLAAALETLSGDPSWRPRLGVPWPVAALGAVGCFWVMFLISPLAALVAIAIELLLWLLLARREQESGWGDVRRGVYQSLIRWSLIRLARRPMNARNWRPHIIVFADDVERRLDLVRYGSWFSQQRGVVTVVELVVGDLLRENIPIREKQRQTRELLARNGIVAFAEVDVVRDVIDGMTDVAQANGIAGLDSNTIVIGWPRETPRVMEFLQVAARLEKLKKSVVLARIQPGLIPREGEWREIHIWWGGLQRNGDLMLLLAHLLSRNPEWRRARLRILSVASSPLMKERTEANLARFLPEIRIHAEATVMLRPEGRPIREIIHKQSALADIVFLGLNIPEDHRQLLSYAERLNELAEPLRTVFFVKNSSLFVGKLVQTTDELATVPEAPVAPDPAPAPSGA